MALTSLQGAMILVACVGLIVLLVLAFSRLTGHRRRCTDCGAVLPADAEACSVCEAPSQPAEGRPGAPVPEHEQATHRSFPTPTVDPEQGAINPGVTPGMVRAAFALMMIGLGTRLLGMLEPAGLDLGVPTALTTALTVIGGVGMFLGFVVLDVA